MIEPPALGSPICLHRDLIGTMKHAIVPFPGEGVTSKVKWIDEPPSDAWLVERDVGLSSGDPRSVVDACKLEGLTLDLSPGEPYVSIAESVAYNDDTSRSMMHPRRIMWGDIMTITAHSAFLDRIISSSADNLRSANLRYFSTVWWAGNRFLGSLVASHVDGSKVDRLVEIGLAPHLFRGMRNDRSSKGRNDPVEDVSPELRRCSVVTYNRFGTRTGRLGVVSGPEVLTLPKKLRGLFRPSVTGRRLMCADISSLEPQLMAFLSGRSAPLVDVYDDIRQIVVDDQKLLVTPERNVIKEAVICEMFGSGAKKLADNLSLPLDDVKLLMSYVRSYLGAANIKRNLLVEYAGFRGGGVGIRNAYGRLCLDAEPLPHILLNTFAQSTGADVSLLVAASFCGLKASWEIAPLFTVHDALFFECDDSASIPSTVLVNVEGFSQPFKLKVTSLERV